MLPRHCEALPLHRQSTVSVLHIVGQTSLSLVMHVSSAAKARQPGNWHHVQHRLISQALNPVAGGPQRGHDPQRAACSGRHLAHPKC